MYAAVLVSILVVAGAVADPLADFIPYNYHGKYGFKLAAAIKEAEDNIIKSGSGHSGQRIIGGPVTDISETPYQAGLVINFVSITSACGASLISSTRLITAAHCHADGINIVLFHTVVLGSNFIFSGGVRIDTNDVVTHPNYSLLSLANDIAVMRITPVTFSNVIQPISLPNVNLDYSGYEAIVSGFGLTSDGGTLVPNQVLSALNVTIITNAACAASFGSMIQSSNICTGGVFGQGICSSDSGGPLAVRLPNQNVLVGAVSFGGRPCSGGLPGVYARITSYLSWITSL